MGVDSSEMVHVGDNREADGGIEALDGAFLYVDVDLRDLPEGLSGAGVVIQWPRWFLPVAAPFLCMEHASVENVDTVGPAGSLGLSEALGLTDFAINFYSLDPGEEFSGGLHTHLDQEEVFYIISGTATFEFADGPHEETETVEVGPDEAVRFAPGEYQTGQNEGDEPIKALALGAPENSEDVRIPGPCQECGEDTLQLGFDDEGELIAVCPACGAGGGS